MTTRIGADRVAPEPTPVVSDARSGSGRGAPGRSCCDRRFIARGRTGAILFGILLLAVGRLRAAPFALVFFAIGAAFLPALWDRVDVGADTIVQRGLRKHRTIELTDVDAFRLRRIAFPLLQGIHRGYKIGRFWSIPLTLRLLHREEVLLELRCGWWNGWRELARYIVVSCPDADLDGRTRGRLERYVGVPLPPLSQE